jgi:hypothetical protein
MVAATLRHLTSLRKMVCSFSFRFDQFEAYSSYSEEIPVGFTLCYKMQRTSECISCESIMSWKCRVEFGACNRTFMTMRQPSLFFRALILGAQGVFYNMFCASFIVSFFFCFVLLTKGTFSLLIYLLTSNIPSFCSLPGRRGGHYIARIPNLLVRISY